LEDAVKLLKKLQNPFALVFQGFVLGSVLLWTTQSDASGRGAAHVPAAAIGPAATH
jgi:hypothetical protein